MEEYLTRLADLIHRMQEAGVHQPDFYTAYGELLEVDSDLYTAFDRLMHDDAQARQVYYETMNIPETLRLR